MRNDIPFPVLYRHRQWGALLINMDVGDSVLVEADHDLAVRVSATRYGKRLGRKFTARSSSQGTRIWRTA